MSSELDDWENWETPGEETGSVFPIKKQSIKEKEIKEEIERTNQQSVNDLFKVKTTATISAPVTTTTATNTFTLMKTNSAYTNYAKECSNKMKTNKATSHNILVFCKTIIDENCLRVSAEHLEELLEHIHKLKESKLFKPINKTEQIKLQTQFHQQNHEEVFGDCTGDFDEEHLRLESKYA